MWEKIEAVCVYIRSGEALSNFILYFSTASNVAQPTYIRDFRAYHIPDNDTIELLLRRTSQEALIQLSGSVSWIY